MTWVATGITGGSALLSFLGSRRQPTQQTTTTQTEIPAFLRPLLERGSAAGSASIDQLVNSLLDPNASIVSPFNETQNRALSLGLDRAMGAGGYFPTAQDELLSTARGRGIDSFIGSDTLSGLGSFGGTGFLPSPSLDVFTEMARGGQLPSAATNTLSRATGSSAIPVEARDAAGRVLNAELLPGTDTLERTANGDFLFGGPGFDQAVEAAVRSATPGIVSTFGRSGVGGATSGLAQEAVGRAAIDAFASQYGTERGRQLQAADALAGLGLSRNQQQLSAAGLLGDLGLSDRAQQIGAADRLGSLGLAEGNLRLGAGGALADVANAERSRELSSLGLLAGLSEGERVRQLQAAGALPSLAFQDVDALFGLGDRMQAQSQRELTGPIQQYQMLLDAALRGTAAGGPVTGSSTTQPLYNDPMGNFLGLSSLGFGLADQFGGGRLNTLSRQPVGQRQPNLPNIQWLPG